MAPRRILRQSEQDAIFREAGAPEHPDAQWRADYLRKLYDNATHHNDPGVTGGPTMNAEDLPQSGTMVSIPGAEKQYPTMPSSQQVKEYFDTHHFGPEDYPGGWEWPPANDPSHHDTPRFYMDESRNYADPWEAGQAALEGDQIGVYDLSGDWSEQGKPSSVLTNQFINDQIAKGGARVGQSTHDTRRGTRPSGREVSQSGTGRGAGTAGSPPVRRANRRSLDAQGVGSAHDSDAVFDWTPAHLASLPDHDWTQHVLGDRDMWIIARLAAPAATMQPYTPGSVKAFDPTGLKPSKGAGGSHGATIYSGPNGEWVIKQPPPDAPYLAYVDVAANHIAQMSGVDTPDTFLSDGKAVGLKPGPISAQVRFPGAKDAYPNKQFDPEKVSDDDLLTIQKHHALDWLLSNHDSHPMGFIRLQDGRLAGIDKGQAAKYFGQDRLHWNFHPNQDYNETEPVYNTLYRNFATGGRQILDPSQGELAKYIQHLQAIPDKEYADIWRPYAEAAAKQGALCHPWHHTGLVPSTIPPNDVEAFLKAAVERKHNLAKDFADLYARAVAHRMTGTKIARSQKVFPATSDSYGTDRAGSHPQSPREGRIAQAALSDPSDIGFGESGPSALIPRRREATVDGFDGVVGLGPGVEMGRLAADFSVAPVQDEGLLRSDRVAGIEDAVRYDMGSDNPLPHHQLSVSRRGKRGGPVPAASFLQPDEFPVNDFDRRGGRITGHVPPEGFFLREVEGAVGAGTLSHIDTSTVGHAPGLFPQARERSLRQAYADTLPLDWDGNEPNPQPLYRGAVLDLRGEGADQVRRSLFGPSNEDIYAPGKGRFAPCRGCPHPVEKIAPPKPGNGVQGGFPLSNDYSDYELAENGKSRWTQMGRDILDLIGDGDDTEWTDDPKTAQKNALSGTGPLQLPVMLGKTQRPDGDPSIDSVRIVHPQTGHWYEIMPGKYQELEASRRQAAALPTEDELSGLQKEFDDWWSAIPEDKRPQPDGNSAWNLYNNPVTSWENVEKFLSEHYPQAHSGAEWSEDAIGSAMGKHRPDYVHPVSDSRTLANMIMLHRRSQGLGLPNRGAWHPDEAALYNTPGMAEAIVKGRNKMQQDYRSRTAGYSIDFKLNDGTKLPSLSADIFTRARGLAGDTAAQHGLEIREKDRSPDDWGRGTQYLPVYRNGEWAGNVIIDRSDNHPLDTGADSGGAMGPHQDAYAYASLRLAYAPDPSTLVNLNKQMGSHGAQLWKDPQGEWLLKKPGKNQEFMIPLDVATSQLQQSVGLEGPEVHAVPMPHPKGGSYLVAAHRMYPGATQAWQRPPHLADVHPDDLLTLQKHQAMDWLIANHDPHVGNFMRTDKGLVGVDKGQALKYFGRDRLDWNFHPNYYAREPIYNNLWREYAHGLPGEMSDPREGELGDFIARVQSIPDDKLREMFYPYATAAARVGLLATGDNDPQRGQTYPRVKPNDPEAFLDALVQRKNHLADDLGELYDRAATHRASASLNQLGGEPLTKPKKLKPRQQLMWAPQYGPGKHELGRPQTKTPDYWQLPEGWDDEGYEDDEW